MWGVGEIAELCQVSNDAPSRLCSRPRATIKNKHFLFSDSLLQGLDTVLSYLLLLLLLAVLLLSPPSRLCLPGEEVVMSERPISLQQERTGPLLRMKRGRG